MTPGQVPAGWYPDPNGGPGQAYWDGSQWLANGSPAPGGFAPYGVPPAGGSVYGGMPYAPTSYGVDVYGRPLSDKSKLVAGLLQIFLGGFGIGRFYLGYTTIGVLQLVVSLLTCGIGAVWPLIDGILIIVGHVPDAQGRTLRD
jgi:TM2 domain-containing membrane protein YozV